MPGEEVVAVGGSTAGSGAGAAVGAGAVGAAGSIVGSLLGASSAKRLQDDAQRWARKRFQARYQSTMRDMLKAGLNPILAGEVGGGGAMSSPMAQPLQQDVGSRAVSSAVEAARAAKELRLIDSQASNNYSQGAKADADAVVQYWKAKAAAADVPGAERFERSLDVLRSQAEANSARAFRDRMDAGRVGLPGVSVPLGVFHQLFNSAAGLDRAEGR